jgi:hypothetical protein
MPVLTRALSYLQSGSMIRKTLFSAYTYFLLKRKQNYKANVVQEMKRFSTRQVCKVRVLCRKAQASLSVSNSMSPKECIEVKNTQVQTLAQ